MVPLDAIHAPERAEVMSPATLRGSLPITVAEVRLQ